MKHLTFLVISFLFCSCAQLPEYKKVWVNDDEMETGVSDLDALLENPKTYREGSQGGNKGKSGGGCGCN